MASAWPFLCTVQRAPPLLVLRRWSQVTLGALEELHTQLQLSFVEGEKEVQLQLVEREFFFYLYRARGHLLLQMGAFSSRISRILNGAEGMEGLWNVGVPSPTPAIAHIQALTGERGSEHAKNADLQRDEDH